jgi:hypothetical protein
MAFQVDYSDQLGRMTHSSDSTRRIDPGLYSLRINWSRRWCNCDAGQKWNMKVNDHNQVTHH